MTKMKKGQVILLHWNAEECEELAEPLRDTGRRSYSSRRLILAA